MDTKKIYRSLFIVGLGILSSLSNSSVTYALDTNIINQNTVSSVRENVDGLDNLKRKIKSTDIPNSSAIKEFKFASRRDSKEEKLRKMEEYQEILQDTGYNYLQEGIMERLYPYLEYQPEQYDDRPFFRGGILKKQEIFEDTIASDFIVQSDRAARERTKKFGLSRSTARYDDARVIKSPKLYGPYLSAMLADEDLQELIGDREEEIVAAVGEREEEISILNRRFKKAEKAKINLRKDEEKIKYGRVLGPAENPDATFKEKLIDMEARRRLQLEDWTTTFNIIDSTDALNIDKVLRKKVDLHPYNYKYRSPRYLEDDLVERAPDDIIHVKDLVPQLIEEDAWLVNDARNVSRNSLMKYRDFNLDNLIHYGPTSAEILRFVCIIGFIRFCFMSLKYNPKLGFIISGGGVIAAYAYVQLLTPICLNGANAFPGWPRLFRLGMDYSDIQYWDDWINKSKEYRMLRNSSSFVAEDDLRRQSFISYTIGNVISWLRFKLQNSTTAQSFLESFPGLSALKETYLFIEQIIGFVLSTILNLAYKNYEAIQQIASTVFLQQVLRSGRRFMPYPIVWHWGTCYIINSFFLPKWLSFLSKSDRYIVETLVPEMRYQDIITAEYVRTYLLIYAIYLILLAMLHALFNQYYYLPFISETTDAFFGRRKDFKAEIDILKDERVKGGDLSWQDKWEYWEPRKEGITVWHGLFGKPRKYKFPKWMRIFNPMWWLKRWRRK